MLPSGANVKRVAVFSVGLALLPCCAGGGRAEPCVAAAPPAAEAPSAAAPAPAPSRAPTATELARLTRAELERQLTTELAALGAGGRPEPVIALQLALLEREPSQAANITLKVAVLYATTPDDAAAADWARRATALLPTSATAHRLLGEALLRRATAEGSRVPAEARAALARAHELGPDDDATRDALATLYRTEGDRLRALNLLGGAANDDPTAARYLALARGFAEVGLHGHAVQTAELAREFQPTRTETLELEELIARESAEAARFQAALEPVLALAPPERVAALEALATAAPDNPVVLGLLAEALLAAGRAREAASRAERAATLEPPAPGALLTLAAAHVASGRVSEALAAYERATSLYPADARAWRQLCALQYQTGALARAASACRETLRRDPADPEALYFLAVSLDGAGRAGEALEAAHALEAAAPLRHGAKELVERLEQKARGAGRVPPR